jgi:hypothetical protein
VAIPTKITTADIFKQTEPRRDGNPSTIRAWTTAHAMRLHKGLELKSLEPGVQIGRDLLNAKVRDHVVAISSGASNFELSATKAVRELVLYIASPADTTKEVLAF